MEILKWSFPSQKVEINFRAEEVVPIGWNVIYYLAATNCAEISLLNIFTEWEYFGMKW